MALILAAGCEEGGPRRDAGGSTTPAYERVERGEVPASDLQMPVRIGELGPSFRACASRGVARRGVEGGLAVRAAPFEAARETGRIPAVSGFFVCARSHDQKWFGVVYDASGGLVTDCGVSAPLPAGRNYEGPCRSGWVSSAAVRLSGT